VSVKEKLKQLKCKRGYADADRHADPDPAMLHDAPATCRYPDPATQPLPLLYPNCTVQRKIIREAITYNSRARAGFFHSQPVKQLRCGRLEPEKMGPGVKTVVATADGRHKLKDHARFITGEYDVQIATTIIESGVTFRCQHHHH
jgi:hypothetical protein